MKTIKRLLTTVLTFMLVFTMMVPTQAATPELSGKASLTMKDESGSIKDTSSYAAYKIIDWNAGKASDKIVYTDMSIVKQYLKTLQTVTQKTDEDEIIQSLVKEIHDSQTMKTLAHELSQVVGTADYTTVNGQFENMDYGYYLIVETSNTAGDGTVISKPILISLPSTETGDVVAVNVKTSSADIEKKIIEDGKPVDSNSAAIGDTIHYQTISGIPTYPISSTGIVYKITDTMSTGLTFKSMDQVQVIDDMGTLVQSLVLDKDYSFSTTAINNATFVMTLLNDQDIKAWGNQGYRIQTSYSAVLNENAVLGIDGNTNKVNLTYSNNPSVENDHYTTPDDIVVTYSTALTILKIDDDKEVLSGAVFKLSKLVNGKYEMIAENLTTNEFGEAVMEGLDAGQYRLEETQAPNGYNQLKDPIDFEIKVQVPGSVVTGDEQAIWSSDSPVLEYLKDEAGNLTGKFGVTIQNTVGVVLPGTGGMGTTLFTIGGLSLMALAGILFIIYKKQNHKTV